MGGNRENSRGLGVFKLNTILFQLREHKFLTPFLKINFYSDTLLALSLQFTAFQK